MHGNSIYFHHHQGKSVSSMAIALQGGALLEERLHALRDAKLAEAPQQWLFVTLQRAF